MSRKAAMNNMCQNDTLNIPDFSFGTKAVIRPLPTTTSTQTSTIKQLSELRQKVTATAQALIIPNPSNSSGTRKP